MQHAGPGPARSLVGAAVLVCLAAILWPTAFLDARVPHAPESASEIRALWVLRTALASPESILALVRSARAHGFNALLVQVRGRGDAFYRGGIEPRASGLSRQPETFDPLAEVLRAAEGTGLRVHAWVNVNLVSSAVDLPQAPDHIVRRRPEWLMVPRELAQELAGMEATSSAYVSRLAGWTRTQSADVEGLYATPLQPAAAQHMAAVVRDLVRRYPVDGVHFDYARFPNDRFDYSRQSLNAFRAEVEPGLPAPRRRDLALKAQRTMLAHADALPDEWRRFRLARMTAMMAALREVVKAERPGAIVSVAVKADMREALGHRLQEWPRWLERGTVDAVAPMAYTTEAQRFADQIAAARAAAAGRQVWAGIGAYRLPAAQTIARIATARRLGADGIVLFSYDSLTDPRHATPNYLSVVGRAAFLPAGAIEGSR